MLNELQRDQGEGAATSTSNNSLSVGNNNRRVVVLAGASGFIGKHLLQLLLHPQASLVYDEIVCLVRRGSHRSSFLTSMAINASISVTQISCSTLSHKDPNAFEREITSLMSHQQYKGRIACLVNLVGIKKETRHDSLLSLVTSSRSSSHDEATNSSVVTFRGAHVNVTRNLLRLTEILSVPHYVHVSVLAAIRDDFATESYHHTKWESEQLILQQHQQQKHGSSDDSFSFTIVRPSVVFGEGDDMITNLVRSIKHLPIFPLPGDGNSIHQPVHVTYVAKVLEREMRRPSGRNEIIEAVGPTKLPLRRMIEIVNEGTGLPKMYLVPTPIKLVKIAAEAMAAIFDDPLITPAQVKMLSEGMSSAKDETFTKNQDTFQKELTPELVYSMQASVSPFLGVSARLLCDDKDYDWMERFGSAFSLNGSLMQSGRRRSNLWLASMLLLFFLVVSFISNAMFSSEVSPNQVANPDVWYKLLFVDLLIIPASIYALRQMTDQWRYLLKPTVKGTIIGIVFAIVTYFMSLMGVVTVTTFLPREMTEPTLTQLAQLKDTRDQVSPGTGFTFLLLVLIPAEELLWRTALLLPLCAYFSGASGTGRTELEENIAAKSRRRDLGILGCLVSSGLWALSHRIFFSTWIVGMAAMVMGVLWCGLVLRTKSTYNAIVAHLVWDVLTVYIFPIF
eukprot:TRINITY_DN8693_c0_g5_i1.p1 TRINITY_DN8693_c0_g5~~TRINITY_DN8693_c0_g5_i1.p1  ORF type:complete len:677 (+),score=138.42 TRINITY_DN8693_c0_g5_i1:78-2108(+)